MEGLLEAGDMVKQKSAMDDIERRCDMDIMELDESVYGVCRDWYDRETVPLMTKVAFRHSEKHGDIPIQRLLVEIEKCQAENLYERDRPMLAAAVEWCRGVIEREAVMKAATALVARARRAGFEDREFEKAIRDAWHAFDV